jgi:hypothetical protein
MLPALAKLKKKRRLNRSRVPIYCCPSQMVNHDNSCSPRTPLSTQFGAVWKCYMSLRSLMFSESGQLAPKFDFMLGADGTARLPLLKFPKASMSPTPGPRRRAAALQAIRVGLAAAQAATRVVAAAVSLLNPQLSAGGPATVVHRCVWDSCGS